MYYVVSFDKGKRPSSHLPSQDIRKGLCGPSGVGTFRILIWVLVTLNVTVLTSVTRDEFCLLNFLCVESYSLHSSCLVPFIRHYVCRIFPCWCMCWLFAPCFAEWDSICWMGSSHLIGYLGCFQFGATMNKTAMSLLVHALWGT